MSDHVNEEDGLAEMGIPSTDEVKNSASPNSIRRTKIETPFMVSDDEGTEVENGVDEEDGCVHSSRKRRSSGLQALLADDVPNASKISPDANIQELEAGLDRLSAATSDSDEFNEAENGSTHLETVSSDELTYLEQDQDLLNNIEWKLQRRHVFILSEAGKPVFSRHGSEDKLVTLFGLMQALVSVVEDGNDVLRSIKIGPTKIVFLHKTPLILVCVSRLDECVVQIQTQLLYFYNQVISILTSKQLHQIFEKRRNYDLRRLLAGSERLLTNLSDLLEDDPSFVLGAVKCLPLLSSVREIISQTIIQFTSKLQNVVFAILIANNQLVTLVRMKRCFMHPMDLHIILNLIDSSESFKTAESWTPICLPRFDSSGFVHAHVSYLADDCQACLVLLTADRESFFILSAARQKIVDKLRRHNCLEAINTGMSSSWPLMSSLNVPEIRHFIYKYRSIAQYTSSVLDIPYKDKEPTVVRLDPEDPESKPRASEEFRKLFSTYCRIHSRLHNHSRPLKLLYFVGDTENWMGWVTSTFELYVTFEPLVKKTAAINAVNKLIKWVKKEEERLFIINSPTF